MKKAGWIITGILVIALIIGGIFYIKRQNDKQELLDTQKDIANYVYNNYSVWTEDEQKLDKIIEEFDKGNGNMTTEEYLNKVDDLKEYTEITSIKFTSASVNEMGSLVFYLTINGVKGFSVALDTISAETDTWKYSLDYVINDDSTYYFEKREAPTNLNFDESKITYYKGGID